MAIVNGAQMYEDAIRRIQELEKLNDLLAEQIDRQRPVIEAAKVLTRSLRRHEPASWSGTEEALERVVTEYERNMARLAKECE